MSQRTAVSHTRPSPSRRPRLSKVTNARDALADFGRGMETYCLTFGQFSLMDAVEAILEKTGPADVAISTWTAGNADLSRSAEHLHNGNIRSLRFVADCSFGQRQPGYLAELVRLFGAEAIRTTRTHAKFVVITNDDWQVAVRTSMNLNAVGDFSTKSRPALAGMDAILPLASVAMSRGGVRVGASPA